LFLLRVNPSVAFQLIGLDGQRADALERSLGKHVYIRSDPTRPADGVDIVPTSAASLARQISLPTPGQRIEAVVMQAPSNGTAMAVADGYHVALKQVSADVGTTVKARLKKVGRSLGEAVPLSAQRPPRPAGRGGRQPGGSPPARQQDTAGLRRERNPG